MERKALRCNGQVHLENEKKLIVIISVYRNYFYNFRSDLIDLMMDSRYNSADW